MNIPCEYGKNNIVITTYDLEGNAVNTSLHVDVCNLDAMHANTNAIAKVGMFEDKNIERVFTNESGNSFCVVKLV